jgi:hypothetical protein
MYRCQSVITIEAIETSHITLLISMAHQTFIYIIVPAVEPKKYYETVYWDGLWIRAFHPSFKEKKYETNTAIQFA